MRSGEILGMFSKGHQIGFADTSGVDCEKLSYQGFSLGTRKTELPSTEMRTGKGGGGLKA
jgi:hypothetical protein